jgi:hypothetical protein
MPGFGTGAAVGVASGAAFGAAIANQQASQHYQETEDAAAQQTERLANLGLASDQATEVAASGVPLNDGGQQAIVLYEYEAGEDNEMSLVEGETIVRVVELDEGASFCFSFLGCCWKLSHRLVAGREHGWNAVGHVSQQCPSGIAQRAMLT